ncbi:hypothetical protein PIB30_097251 [Stylosanthes scabra]|uniref:Uncharacterized protein n=1 Tax=Stylosanthes scabra TaxID=79078 RepID=A0ABU6TWU8_9FABA|nr:hypothetical protein [Stylosanthes scabra]
MLPLAEEGRRCSARISGGRVRARPRAGGRMRNRAETMVTRRLSTIGRRTFLSGLGPRVRGDEHAPHEPDVDFFSGADLELARFILQGEGSGSGSAPHASVAGTSVHRFGPRNEMPGPLLQPHHDPAQQCQGFQYYQPSQQSYL